MSPIFLDHHCDQGHGRVAGRSGEKGPECKLLPWCWLDRIVLFGSVQPTNLCFVCPVWAELYTKWLTLLDCVHCKTKKQSIRALTAPLRLENVSDLVVRCNFSSMGLICFFLCTYNLSVKPTKAYSRGSVVMVDEIMNASPTKFRFPEAGLRVMVTSHFGPKTRLRMASRLIITEVQLFVVALPGGLSCYCYMWKIEWFPDPTRTGFIINEGRNRNVAVAQQTG